MSVDVLYDLWIGTEVLQPRSVTVLNINREPFKHDHAIIETKSIPLKGMLDAVGSPIRFSWGRPATGKATFYGYVESVEPRIDSTKMRPTGSAPLRINVYGCSSVIKETRNRSWTDRTVHSIISEVAREYRMHLVGDQDDVAWPSIVQANETDWQLICRLARMIGYDLVTDNTILNLIDPYRASNRQTSVLRFGTGEAPGRTTLYAFTPFLTRTTPDSGEHTLQGLTPEGHAVEYRSGWRGGGSGLGMVEVDDGRVTFHNEPVRSAQHAKAIVNGAKRRANWPLQATLETNGNISALPGALVAVDGVRAEYGGLWYIASVTHRVISGSFTSCIEAKKDAVLGSPRTVGRGVSSGRLPSTRLNGNREWQAAFS